MTRVKPTRRDLLLVVGRLQELVGDASTYHGNDRDPNGFEKGQEKLKEAFSLCVAARSFDPPLEDKKSPRGWP